MALPAERVEFIGRKTPRIPEAEHRRVPRVRGCGTVTYFTTHTQFIWSDRAIGRYPKRSGRVAGKTSLDAGRRVGNPVANTCRSEMAGCPGVTGDRTIPALTFFQVVFRIQPPDKRDRL